MSVTTQTNGERQDYRTTVGVYRSEADRIQRLKGDESAREFIQRLLDYHEARIHLDQTLGGE